MCDIVIMERFNMFNAKKSMFKNACYCMGRQLKCTLQIHVPKIDKTKILKTNGSLLNVESFAECSFGAFCNTFDLH